MEHQALFAPHMRSDSLPTYIKNEHSRRGRMDLPPADFHRETIDEQLNRLRDPSWLLSPRKAPDPPSRTSSFDFDEGLRPSIHLSDGSAVSVYRDERHGCNTEMSNGDGDLDSLRAMFAEADEKQRKRNHRAAAIGAGVALYGDAAQRLFAERVKQQVKEELGHAALQQQKLTSFAMTMPPPPRRRHTEGTHFARGTARSAKDKSGRWEKLKLKPDADI